MSRLGDLLKKERVARKLSEKQVAKLCGVSETYILQVERGERVINDEQLLRMLRKIGASEDVLLPFAVQEAVPQAPEPAPRSVPAPREEGPRILASARSETAVPEPWVQALSGAQKIPIYDARKTRIGESGVATDNGKLYGLPAEKACYLLVSDDSLRAYGVLPGDRLLMLPTNQAMSQCIQWVEMQGALSLYWVYRLEGNNALLQRWENGRLVARTIPIASAKFLMRAVRVERELDLP